MVRRAEEVKPRLQPEHLALVEQLLGEDWSPVQISLCLAQQKRLTISHERIYQYVLDDKRHGGDLHRHLPYQKGRKKHYGIYERRGQLSSIDERPAIVERRSRIGDWELDTIVGKHHRQALVSLTERKWRMTLIAKVATKAADNVEDAVIDLLGLLSNRVHTITSDNGKEFASHECIAETLGAAFYIAHPYASWGRGLNENANGLNRTVLPKGQRI